LNFLRTAGYRVFFAINLLEGGNSKSTQKSLQHEMNGIVLGHIATFTVAEKGAYHAAT